MSFLNVDASLSGRTWQHLSQETLDKAQRLESVAGIDSVTAKIYAARGARVETLEQFLNPKLRDLLPDPNILKDMELATDRILSAIKTNESVAIFGDYDVDGATSSALLFEYFEALEITPTIYIPDRLTEGYGPNLPAMEALSKSHSLIICVDCGTLSFEPIEAAVANGAEVIVLDHHMAAEKLPQAITVNPNRQDCDNGYGYLCAAGVVFLLLIALNRKRNERTPDLMNALDLVALATIADVAPLKELNRAFVQTGLKVMNARKRIGLALLIDSHLKYRSVVASDIGFIIGPRLNAGGRIGRSIAATELLTTKSPDLAQKIVAEIEEQNLQRREIEAAITQEAKAQVESNTEQNSHFVYAFGENWHPGVLGIVASRIKSIFGKPALIMCVSKGEITGSARSLQGIDLGGAIARLTMEGLLVKGGGHKMAAGLSLMPENLLTAMKRLDELIHRQSSTQNEHLNIDALIIPNAISIERINEIEKAGPFGTASPHPIFAISDVILENITILKDVHIKYRFRSNGQTFEVMAFGAAGSPLDIRAYQNTLQSYHLAVRISKNFWQGREKIQYLLEDIAISK